MSRQNICFHGEIRKIFIGYLHFVGWVALSWHLNGCIELAFKWPCQHYLSYIQPAGFPCHTFPWQAQLSK